MIDREYCMMMARYNTWQNKQLTGYLEVLDPQELTRDRGAFFGSIFATISHLHWGDHIWISRFDGGPGPDGGIKDSSELFPTLAVWSAERFRLDGRIRIWAENVRSVDLSGDFTWYSGASGKEITRPMAKVVTHFFNHQTHHRGQVHAMLTATGSKAPVSDLAFMPDTF